MPTIDLNCDLGEGGANDVELLSLVTSANIACGAHAGDLNTMIEAVERATANGVAVGAHPGFFDLENFGRTERAISPEEAGRVVLMQVEQFAEIAGSAMHHVKLHGALYNQVSRDAALADAVASDLARWWPQLLVFALAGSQLVLAARSRGLRVAEEAFADRTYQSDGTLTPRTHANALVPTAELAAAQAVRMVREGLVGATDGTEVRIKADTICLHGDGPHAVEFARQLRAELKKARIGIKAVGA